MDPFQAFTWPYCDLFSFHTYCNKTTICGKFPRFKVSRLQLLQLISDRNRFYQAKYRTKQVRKTFPLRQMPRISRHGCAVSTPDHGGHNDIKHVHDRPRARHHLARHRIFIEELLARITSKFTDIIRKQNTTKRTVLFDLLLNIERWKPVTEN